MDLCCKIIRCPRKISPSGLMHVVGVQPAGISIKEKWEVLAVDPCDRTSERFELAESAAIELAERHGFATWDDVELVNEQKKKQPA